MITPIELIGYASGVSAGNPGCGKGPGYLKESALLDSCATPWHWHSMLNPQGPSQGLEALTTVTKLCTDLAQITQTLTEQGTQFATIGGDHACGIGSWSGAAAALAPRGDLGLIWCDAHLDAHTFASTPSGNIHGMPIACLLGYGESALIHIASQTPKIKPQNLCFIGIRDFEPEESELLEKLRVRIITMDEVNQRGFDDCMQEALEIANQGTAGFGISVDLDGFDPKLAPGVGTPVDHGLAFDSFCHFIKQQPLENLVGIEIVEFNPEEDLDDRTAKLFEPLLDSFFAPIP
jgi:arginase